MVLRLEFKQHPDTWGAMNMHTVNLEVTPEAVALLERMESAEPLPGRPLDTKAELRECAQHLRKLVAERDLVVDNPILPVQ